MKIARALVSVSDKTNLEFLVKKLNGMGVEIISTGGTAKMIKSLNVPVIEIDEYTGSPEMLGGRVKTLQPKVHAGLLALRDDEKHKKEMEEAGIPYIDMVVVNLYPFEETVAKEGVSFDEAIENIDIGGPTMLRSAAKNLGSVAVISDPHQYEEVVFAMENNDGAIPRDILKKLATEVFRKTSEYNRAIYEYLSKEEGEERADFSLKAEKVYDLRYGENPHQKASFYKDTDGALGIADAVVHQGKELSYNNILDINAAVMMAADFKEPAVSIVKHNNPCGIASADTLEKAYVDALDCDRLSAFGSIMAFNGKITETLAALILEEASFVECIIAPEYEPSALEVFKAKKNLRILELDFVSKTFAPQKDIKKVKGGVLVQDTDLIDFNEEDLKVVTETKPDEATMKALLFGWKVVKFVKSNAIVLNQDTKTVGIGAGQMSRVDSVITAVRKADDRAKGSCLASDAFFPVPDSIERAHEAGIKAIIQPGGSIKDAEVIEACNKFKIPMILTGTRHFKL